ncbi:FecR family protein [Chitinophaga agrisoli]|uniref:FecR family protein n=1 Tax=Chitinophaga agrisoli TaxID=2607653 RepID=A0A5B2VU12_9BACT|nr:FecR family protein [Chitinophaga agrisoli]KAA2241726.1 FecR family protein [Chitinophaga agrisoli]
MQLPPDRMRYLMRQYIEGRCTREEMEELYAAIASAKDEELSGLLEDEFNATGPGPGVQEVDWDHLFNRIVKTRPATPTRRITAWWKYAAAAAVILLAGVGGFYWYQQQQVKPAIAMDQASRPAVQDAQPGGNKAVLTLADGSTVTLDSAGNRLMQQGSTAVHQQGGTLQYNAAGSNADVSYNTLTTPRGGQFQLTLPDGTKVWLNAASSLTFPVAFTGRERAVTLTGEAYFEVVHNAAMPFKVHVEGMEVADLGTRFNIMAYHDENAIKTTLIEGAVGVSDGRKEALLKPGQQAVLDKRSTAGLKVQAADIDQAIAWKNGEFFFDHTSIYEIMRQVSRWYDVEVGYQDSLNAYLSGNIRKNVNVSEVFRMLELAGDVRFKIENKKATVMK